MAAAIEVAVGPPGRERPHRLVPGEGRHAWFKDLEIGPEMVVVPAGRFLMGAGDDEPEARSSERPAHAVTFARSFAIGRFAVTFEEWDAAVAQGGPERLPDDQGWGRGRRPVIGVCWAEAAAYAAWLAAASGKAYRLPSEAEWEYAARAGTRSRYWWGDGIDGSRAQVQLELRPGYRDPPERRRTLPVDSFEPNPWGLYQVHGNVREWCQDPYPYRRDDYRGAPNDGSVWDSDDRRHRVLRGGAWGGHPKLARAAKRTRNDAETRASSIGFRVARSLEP